MAIRVPGYSLGKLEPVPASISLLLFSEHLQQEHGDSEAWSFLHMLVKQFIKFLRIAVEEKKKTMGSKVVLRALMMRTSVLQLELFFRMKPTTWDTL